VDNGEEAIAYLTGRDRYRDRLAFPFPRVIITDLKMPQMDGIEFLRWIHEHPRYRVVPTIVLTSSTDKNDVQHAFSYGASGYMIKPLGLEPLERLAKIVADYWTASLVPLPDNPL
jgi:CheY-like chemotaxis protein